MKKEYWINFRCTSTRYIEDFTDPNWDGTCKLPTYGNSDSTVEIAIDGESLIILEKTHPENISMLTDDSESEGMRAEKIVLPLRSLDYFAIFKDTEAEDMVTMKIQMGFGDFTLLLAFMTDPTFVDFLSNFSN